MKFINRVNLIHILVLLKYSYRSSSRLTTENIRCLEKLFRENVGDGNEIRKEDFKRIIQTKNVSFRILHNCSVSWI